MKKNVQWDYNDLYNIGTNVIIMYSQLAITQTFKGNLKKFRVIGSSSTGSSKNIAESKVKNFLLHSEHFNHI